MLQAERRGAPPTEGVRNESRRPPSASPASAAAVGHPQHQRPLAAAAVGMAPATAPSDLLDGIDAEENRRGLLPRNPCDRQGTRHALRRPSVRRGQARKRAALRLMAEERAPW